MPLIFNINMKHSRSEPVVFIEILLQGITWFRLNRAKFGGYSPAL